MCKNWAKSQKCPFKECTYAHGQRELDHYLHGIPLESESEEEKASSSDEQVIPPVKYAKPAPKLESVDLTTIFDKYPEDTKMKMLQKQQKESEEKINNLQNVNDNLVSKVTKLEQELAEKSRRLEEAEKLINTF